jgi:hypothetical protein
MENSLRFSNLPVLELAFYRSPWQAARKSESTYDFF